ncbi:MAG: PEP-CTERM sorting domain-containing protein [Pyrinomonadaceae bacterium]
MTAAAPRLFCRSSVPVKTFAESATGQPATFVSTDLVGQGTARLSFISVAGANGQRIQQLQSVTYTFAPAAVPEPCTLLLLGSGLAGVCENVRRRRRAKG